MAAWHLAPSLVQLQKELDAKYPGRPKDGTIGDDSHAARDSEHNPDRDSDGMPRGAVSAMDIYTGKVPSSLVSTLVKDDRTWYAIHKGKIYRRKTGFKAEKYTGPNPHTNHIHISLNQTKTAHDSKAPWLAVAAPPKPAPGPNLLPTLVLGAHGPYVAFLKRYFGLPNTEHYDLQLAGFVRRFQDRHGLVVDGVVGPKTWAAIARGGTTLPKY